MSNTPPADHSSTSWLKRYFNPSSPNGLPRTGRYAAALLCLMLFGILLGIVRHAHHAVLLDASAQTSLDSLRSHGLTVFFVHVSELASTNAIISLWVISAALLFWRNREKLAVLFGIVIVLDGVVVQSLKTLVARHRPDAALALVHETSFSFPSGHTMAATLCWGFVAYIFALSVSASRRWVVVTVWAVLVLLVGLSRVYLGAHYLSDVIGSILLGGGLLGLIILWLTDHPKQLPKELFGREVVWIFSAAFAILFVLTVTIPKLFG